MSPVDLVTSEGRVAVGEWSKEKEGDHHSGTHCHQGEVVEGEEELGQPGNVGGKGGRGRRHLVPPNNPSGYSTSYSTVPRPPPQPAFITSSKSGSGLGTYSSPNRKFVTRVGYTVGQGFHFQLFQKQCGGGL